MACNQTIILNYIRLVWVFFGFFFLFFYFVQHALEISSICERSWPQLLFNSHWNYSLSLKGCSGVRSRLIGSIIDKLLTALIMLTGSHLKISWQRGANAVFGSSYFNQINSFVRLDLREVWCMQVSCKMPLEKWVCCFLFATFLFY